MPKKLPVFEKQQNKAQRSGGLDGGWGFLPTAFLLLLYSERFG